MIAEMIVFSPAATGLPRGKPQTDDMREMVDHFERLGLIRRVPAIYQLPNGLVVAHPSFSGIKI